MQSITVFFDLTEVADVSRAQEACHVNHIFLGSSLGVPSFTIAKYEWHILWRGPLPPSTLPHSSVSTPKKSIYNKVNNCSVKISFQKISFFYLMGTHIKNTFQTEISILTFQWWEELLMHTGISLLSIFFLSKEFHKLLCFHLFKNVVLSDEGVNTLVIFQWYSTKKLYCCGFNVQI